MAGGVVPTTYNPNAYQLGTLGGAQTVWGEVFTGPALPGSTAYRYFVGAGATPVWPVPAVLDSVAVVFVDALTGFQINVPARPASVPGPQPYVPGVDIAPYTDPSSSVNVLYIRDVFRNYIDAPVGAPFRCQHDYRLAPTVRTAQGVAGTNPLIGAGLNESPDGSPNAAGNVILGHNYFGKPTFTFPALQSPLDFPTASEHHWDWDADGFGNPRIGTNILFAGVPKFYRDCYEQGVLGEDREAVLAKMFFRSSSPLRSEAENWFLSELRGRYDVVLKYVARHPGCTNGDIEAHVREISNDTAEQVGGYLKVLREKYRMLERRLPIFARPSARRGRYYLRDNFLRSWLAALHSPVSALNFRPERELVDKANDGLRRAEGHGLERLVAQLYEERSRKAVGDFQLTARVEGFWDRSDTEIDLVALDEESKTIRFGTCKRSPGKLLGQLEAFDGHVERFLNAHPKYGSWKIEKAAFSASIPAELRRPLAEQGFIAEDLSDLTRGL
ncbi:MAG: hypothetical protein H6837_02880 [Planctomycetes bacterium]|nr:hypothetical protein [Planctomycetota bacterium]